MSPYSRQLFASREITLWRKASVLVASVRSWDHEGQAIRCHELARAVGEILGLRVQDGHFGFIEHSWLWTEPATSAPGPDGRLRHALPNILDVYVPGVLPQVQLFAAASTYLPMPYTFSEPRGDIRLDVVEHLVKRMKGHAHDQG